MARFLAGFWPTFGQVFGRFLADFFDRFLRIPKNVENQRGGYLGRKFANKFDRFSIGKRYVSQPRFSRDADFDHF